MALANRLTGGSSRDSSTVQKSVTVTDAMQNIAYEETNLHHTYDYADPDICLQHTNTVLKQLGNHEKDHLLLTSKHSKFTTTQALTGNYL